MNYDLTNLFEFYGSDNSKHNQRDKELLESLEYMAYESQTYDIQFQIELEDENSLDNDAYDLTSYYSTEGIAETIKNKGSRAFYTFITMAKKALNFIFGFVINLFKSSIDVKGVLKKVYEKAKKYDKEVDKLISKKFPDGFELESKDYSKRSNSSLILLRSIIDMTQKCLTNANENSDDDAISRGIKLSLNYSSLIKALTTKEAKVEPSLIIEDTKKTEGDVSKITLLKTFTNFIKAGWDKLISFGQNKASNAKEKVQDTAKSVKATLKFKFKTDPSDYITQIEESSKKLADLVELYKEEPSSKTVKASMLVPYFKNQLRLFLNVCTKNNWDYSKAIKQLESLRAKTIKAVDKVEIKEDDKETVKQVQAAMSLLSAMGKSMSDLTPLVKALLNNIKSDIDNLMTEIAKVGSKASKIQ